MRSFLPLIFLVFSLQGSCFRGGPPSQELERQRQSFAKESGGLFTFRISPEVSSDAPVEFVFPQPALRISMDENNPTEVKGYLHHVGVSNKSIELSCLPTWTPLEAGQYIEVSNSFCDEKIVLAPAEKRQLSLQLKVAKYIPLSNDVITYKILVKVQ